MKMRRTKVIAIAVLVIIVALAAVVFAQQPPRQPRTDRPDQRASRQEMLQQLADRLTRQLQLTEEETDVVMPEVRKLMTLKVRGVPELRELRNLQRNRSASNEEITAALTKFRESLAKVRKEIAAAEKKLIDMPEITPRRELVLVTSGVLDNGAWSPLALASRAAPREGERPGRQPEERDQPSRREGR
jgi:hypothetical protein